MQPTPHSSSLLFGLLAILLLPLAGCSDSGTDDTSADTGERRITGIVSSRSAADVAAGAHKFMDAEANARVILRTPEQLAASSDEDIVELLNESDAVLLAALFGEEVSRLRRLLQQQPPAADVPLLAINSDRRITRLSRLDGEYVLADVADDELSDLTVNPEPGEDPRDHLRAQREAFPAQADWLTGRAYYQGRTPENMANLMRWLLARAGDDIQVAAPDPRSTIRYYRAGHSSADAADLALDDGPAVALLDLDTGDRPGDRALLDQTCQALETRGLQCFAVLARWGGASRKAVEQLAQTAAPADLAGVISLQDFVVGGGGNRQAVTDALVELDIPVLKGIRLADREEAAWRLDHEGVPRDKVHYQIAMPELQGISQPMVLATAAAPEIDERTGVRLTLSEPVGERVEAAANRIVRWHRLRALDNADKRVAIVYYNHPPGRQNIGADKLDVPETLHDMLHLLRAAGYSTGELPDSADDLLDTIQDRAVNLPEDREALADLSGRVPSLTADEYRHYFADLPATVRAELTDGPVAYLHARLGETLEEDEHERGREILERSLSDLRNMVRNHDHDARERALDLLRQFEEVWTAVLRGDAEPASAEALRDALVRTGVPGLSGWGEPPGRAMTHDDEMLFPAIEFDNIVIAPQPPRGWEVSERLLHANTTFPPTHQYVGFYHWLRDHFEADAIVYVGRHSTREFLPRRRAGLTPDDYPDLLGGDLPVIYPYIVDGVGEGIQAKRRAMGIMISHLTPPLATTDLYDELLELRQLVETYEAADDPDAPARRQAAATLRERIEEMDLVDDIRRELAHGHDEHDEHDEDDEDDEEAEHEAEDVPIDLDKVDEELLVHEVGHYVTEMQEQHMPLGLHVFGRDWDDEAVDMMLASMAGDGEPEAEWRDSLAISPRRERDHLLAGLDGRFVPPSHGNDPVRTPEVLPTGRNFHALSSDLVPTRIAWAIGRDLAANARADDETTPDGSEAIVLWASDTVRDEGVMVAFGLDMLGIEPEWNSRGIVKGLTRMDLAEAERDHRHDALFTTSGLFRDLYEDQLVWLDLAARLALDASSDTIRSEHPELVDALEAALAPLESDMRDPGGESLQTNRLAASWIEDARGLLDDGHSDVEAGRLAAQRVFGAAPGAYGAGVNRLADRSGAWDDRSELGATYLRRMGHAYGADAAGEPAHEAFTSRLERVGRTYLGRASHVYGLLDNDDGFDFQGGLSVAVENIRGRPPENRVLQHADRDNPRVESLERALLSELRGQNLNPQWIEPLMDHGYAGARTMSADFVDNLWGWQATSPEVVRSWVWDEVHDVYLQDRHNLGLDEFLAEGHNVFVKMHIQATMLVAEARGFWDADPELIRELSASFAELVAEHGLPGSGHTRPDHPMLDEVGERLDDELRAAFEAARAAAQLDAVEERSDPSTIRQVQAADDAPDAEAKDDATEIDTADQPAAAEGQPEAPLWPRLLLALTLLVLFAGGLLIGLRGGLRRV